MNADERLREVIHGGPYELHQWAVLVRLAAWADDDGLLDAPELALIGDWVNGSDRGAQSYVRALKRDGWLRQNKDKRWDISANLRQAHAPTHVEEDHASVLSEPPGVPLFRPDIQ